MNELIEQYNKQIAEDLRIDEMNIKEVQLKLPGKKHFWAARLIQHKIKLDSLDKNLNAIKKEVCAKIVNVSPVSLSPVKVEQAANKHADLVKIHQQIKEEEKIIELLEKVEKIFHSATYDIKNVIEIIRMEQL